MLDEDAVDAVLVLAPVGLHHQVALDASGRRQARPDRKAVRDLGPGRARRSSRRPSGAAWSSASPRTCATPRGSAPSSWVVQQGVIGEPQLWVSGGIGGDWSPDRIVARTPWRHRKLEARRRRRDRHRRPPLPLHPLRDGPDRRGQRLRPYARTRAGRARRASARSSTASERGRGRLLRQHPVRQRRDRHDLLELGRPRRTDRPGRRSRRSTARRAASRATRSSSTTASGPRRRDLYAAASAARTCGGDHFPAGITRLVRPGDARFPRARSGPDGRWRRAARRGCSISRPPSPSSSRPPRTGRSQVADVLNGTVVRLSGGDRRPSTASEASGVSAPTERSRRSSSSRLHDADVSNVSSPWRIVA